MARTLYGANTRTDRRAGIGSGFAGVTLKGSEHNDPWLPPRDFEVLPMPRRPSSPYLQLNGTSWSMRKSRPNYSPQHFSSLWWYLSTAEWSSDGRTTLVELALDYEATVGLTVSTLHQGNVDELQPKTTVFRAMLHRMQEVAGAL